MEKLKNLANCKPSEFLRQTNRVRKAVEVWLDKTEIIKIRRDIPPMKVIPEEATEEEARIIKRENREILERKAKENVSKILDNALENYPEETLNLLGLLCFVELEDVDSHPIKAYMQSLSELMEDDAVLGFFTSLMHLAQKNTGSASGR